MLTGQIRTFTAGVVVLCGGSIESPKLLRRSSMYPELPGAAKAFVGRGLTDHPTTNEIRTEVTNIGNVPIPRDGHAKIIFYSRGRLAGNEIRYPFNVEMNINHEWWHLRENDPAGPLPSTGRSKLDIKFSFGNCLDDTNEVHPAPAFRYVPEISFRNLSWMDHLTGSRFPAVAGWQKSIPDVWVVLNDVTHQILSQFQVDGATPRPEGERWFGEGSGFGWGTVHHSAGSLRMPYRPHRGAAFTAGSVVDEDLRVSGTGNLYVCDMSVMPFSSAANPVRTLVALALRLSRHLR